MKMENLYRSKDIPPLMKVSVMMKGAVCRRYYFNPCSSYFFLQYLQPAHNPNTNHFFTRNAKMRDK